MNTSQTSAELRAIRQEWTHPVVFVPTMGALHEGHLSLFHKARELAGDSGTVVASIFVNPLQFDRADDLASYPRTLERDLAHCEAADVNHVFTPTAADFYQSDHSTLVLEKELSQHLCGASRPGHFDGVGTVVLKLFNVVQPRTAVFGKKDFQQLAIIRRLVRDLSLEVEIVGADIFREADGLALSSRNVNLTEGDRADAPRLRKALLAAQSLGETGERNPENYLASARHQLRGAPSSFRLDYLELVSQETLQPLSTISEPAVLAIAAFYGEVRLIDNIEISPA